MGCKSTLGTLKGKLVVSAGLGGMVVHNLLARDGKRNLGFDVDAERIQKRLTPATG